MTTRHLGRMLVKRGLLASGQIEEVLEQQRHDERSFARIASDLYGLDEAELWGACAAEVRYECPEVNLARETIDPSCQNVISATEAWDSLVLPLRMIDGELLCATTEETLPSALKLIQRRAAVPFRFVIAEIRPLEQFIAERYHYEGVEVAED